MIDDSLPVLEAAALERVRQIGGDALVSRLVLTFLDAAPERVAALVAAAAAEDMVATEKTAHSLKSMAGNVGAVRLQALAAAVEEAAVKGDQDAVREGQAEVEAAYDRVAEWLQEMVAAEEDEGDG